MVLGHTMQACTPNREEGDDTEIHLHTRFFCRPLSLFLCAPCTPIVVAFDIICSPAWFLKHVSVLRQSLAEPFTLPHTNPGGTLGYLRVLHVLLVVILAHDLTYIVVPPLPPTPANTNLTSQVCTIVSFRCSDRDRTLL